MKKLFFLSILFAFSFSACKKETKKIDNKTESTSFNNFLENYNEESYKLFPINATYAGDNRFNDQLPNDLTLDFFNKKKSFYTQTKSDLAKFSDADLSDSEKMSKAVLNWECNENLDRLNFREDLMPINQFWSLPLTIGQFAGGTSAQPFKTVQDYNNWLKRLDLYVVWLDTAQVKMKEGIKKGYVLPKSLIKKIIPQFESLSTGKATDHLFYTPIKNIPDSFSEADKKTIAEAYVKMIDEKIIPAYKKMSDFLKTDYLKAGRESSGISDIPDGTAYYNYLIKYYTTTELTADEIHNIGLSEVENIKLKMDSVKNSVGFKGSLKEFFSAIRTNKKLMPYTKPQQVIDNFNAIHKRMQPQIDKLFGLQPKTPFEVRRTEAFREASASAEYNQGSLDGTRPGIFYLPIPNVKKYNVF